MTHGKVYRYNLKSKCKWDKEFLQCSYIVYMTVYIVYMTCYMYRRHHEDVNRSWMSGNYERNMCTENSEIYIIKDLDQ